ncbi:hypothetical protein ACFLQK_02985 [bacterium]
MDLISINNRPDAGRWPEESLTGAMEVLETDPLFHRIPEEDVPDLLNIALDAGELLAVKMLEQHGVPDPLKLAQRLDLRIIFDITTKGYRKAFNALSSYVANPPTIIIYENTLQLFRETVDEDEVFPGEFLVKLTNICVAHELYHHLEQENFNFINLIYKVAILDLGLLKIERTPGTLSEIAANSFAKRLMGLSFFPTIIHGTLYGHD